MVNARERSFLDDSVPVSDVVSYSMEAKVVQEYWNLPTVYTSKKCRATVRLVQSMVSGGQALTASITNSSKKDDFSNCLLQLMSYHAL